MPSYQNLLTSLRQAFPQPISDPVHDGYVVFSIMRALDQVDALKSQTPMLGSPTAIPTACPLAAPVRSTGAKLWKRSLSQLVHYLQGMFIWRPPPGRKI